MATSLLVDPSNGRVVRSEGWKFPKIRFITPGIVLHFLLFCCLIQLGSVFGARWAWCRINTRLFVGNNIRANNRDDWWLFHPGESWRNLLHVLVEVDRRGGGQDLQSSPAGKLLQSEMWYLTNHKYEQTSKVQNKSKKCHCKEHQTLKVQEKAKSPKSKSRPEYTAFQSTRKTVHKVHPRQ